MNERWIVVGCGYTGAHLARELVAAGADVTITRRAGDVAAEAARLGARGVRVDLADPTSLAALGDTSGAIVVDLAPPGDDPAGEIRNLLAALRPTTARLVYVSSVSVYPPAAGAWVDETWPLAPVTRAGRARVAAEAALASSAIPWISLRAAGIWGPGRGLAERLRAGTFRIVGDGTTHLSRIHVDDLVRAILAAGRRSGVTGAVNVADDDPAPIGPLADAIAASLDLPPPPRVPVASVSPDVAGMLAADRRIANRRLKHDLGVTLRYPSVAAST
ncbi:MAG: NAD(P)H-binding protein [Deltaproteobacteria bacterium]|nr:NAD(P)H-binding protein [Deltaproteobacteria bacterium]